MNRENLSSVSKQTVAILCGGTSPEHEISLLSARNILAAFPKKYRPVVIGIHKDGTFIHLSKPPFFEHPGDPKRIRLARPGNGARGWFSSSQRSICHQRIKYDPGFHEYQHVPQDVGSKQDDLDTVD
ncbi:hypothetical protein FJZ23_02230 [Candidatus Parcubacteria bacterium]|nr:hypothetical protein [Candidatus Parcubacteria bacterium]